MSTPNVPPPAPPPPDLPVLHAIGQGIDAFFNNIVGAFDSFMTKNVNEGGFADMMQNLTAKVSDLGNSMASGAQDYSPFGNKQSTPDVSPVQQKEITAEVTPPAISHDIASQIASSGINVASMQMVHVPETAYVSPVSTPAQATTRGNDISLA